MGGDRTRPSGSASAPTRSESARAVSPAADHTAEITAITARRPWPRFLVVSVIVVLQVGAVTVAAIVSHASSSGAGAAVTLPAAPVTVSRDEKVCDEVAQAAFDLPFDVDVLDYSSFDADMQTLQGMSIPHWAGHLC